MGTLNAAIGCPGNETLAESPPGPTSRALPEVEWLAGLDNRGAGKDRRA
jgi:hypothetical protein